MNYLILATQESGILKPFAIILGYILDIIYRGCSALGIYNIGLCIILFTIVVRLCLLPTTIKQQKFTKINARMTPEITAIQKKYENKKDQNSQLQMNEEVQAVYKKYGTSPTGSCLQLIIQLPILFALYRVIINIPAYVKPVKELYESVINKLDTAALNTYFGLSDVTAGNLDSTTMNECIDRLSGSTRDSTLKLDTDTINSILSYGDESVVSQIKSLYNFFGYDLSMSPSAMYKAGSISFIVALIIPVLAGLFQFASVQLSTKINNAASTTDAGTMGSSMKIMNYTMPLLSVYMCWVLQTGIGLYWVTGSLVMMLMQLLINIYLDKKGIDKIIEENQKKAKKKADKKKEKKGYNREEILEQARKSTKNISGPVAATSTSSALTEEEKEERIRKAREKMAKGEGNYYSKANVNKDKNKK